jgi:protein SCO1/2
VLHDTDGRAVDLGADTDAAVTLVMFGYTNCPDICPISLATLASALRAMDPSDANKVRLLFVTADPARDTPEVLRSYLNGFDDRYIGLTGSIEEIDEAQALANVPPAVRDEPDENGSYAVGHATQMIAYQRDGTARIVYPFGTREGEWLQDLPRLIRGEIPTEPSGAS